MEWHELQRLTKATLVPWDFETLEEAPRREVSAYHIPHTLTP